VLVDESMQLWYGNDWRSDSLVTQTAWIKKMCVARTCARTHAQGTRDARACDHASVRARACLVGRVL
jgi:hypothetical protein